MHPQFLPTCSTNRKRFRGTLIFHQTFDSEVISFWKVSYTVLKIIGLGRTVIIICDLGHRSLGAAVAAAALLFLGRQLRDSQTGGCVSRAAVPGLDGSQKREGVKHWDCLICFFQS